MDREVKPRILIIEDDPDLRRILVFQLEGEGFTADAAVDGEAGFHCIQESVPDCILLDLMMPNMDGFAFLKRLRSMDRTASVPVVVLTASMDDRHRRRSQQYMADSYITKPYDLLKLTNEIRRLCQITETSTS